MAKQVSTYLDAMRHAIGGDPDSRIALVDVLNEAIEFLFNFHPWKWRKRPVIVLGFTPAATPTTVNVTALSRTNNVTTLTVNAAPVPAFQVGDFWTIAGATDATFNGSYQLTNVVSTTQVSYVNNGTNGTTTGGTVAATSPPAFEQFINLPADFGDLVAIEVKSNFMRVVSMTSMAQIMFLRSAINQNPTLALFCALTFPSQVDVNSAPPNPRLEIYPRPLSADPNALQVEYRAGAIRVVNTTDVPNIPPYLERALTLLCRAFIKHYEDESQEIDLADFKEEVSIYIQADGRKQGDYGITLNGAARHRKSRLYRPFTTIPSHGNR